MARSSKLPDLSILQMALLGYQVEKDKIELKIQEIEAQLRGRKIAPTEKTIEKPAVRRVLSEEARSRIAEAQKRRWAAQKQQETPPLEAEPVESEP